MNQGSLGYHWRASPFPTPHHESAVDVPAHPGGAVGHQQKGASPSVMITISLTDPQIWASFLTLTLLEVVLGVDNIIFIAVLVSRLEGAKRVLARQIGLALALVFRVVLLLMLFWLTRLTRPVFEVFGQGVSWRDIILLAGGLFLLIKATHEIHKSIEEAGETGPAPVSAGFLAVVSQIALIDVIFSVDSIVTAIGIAEHIEVMVAAVVVAILVMYVASGAIAGFIERHPTTKMLALSFLILIGVALVADGMGFHIPRGYIYFSMAFAAVVEVFNVLVRQRRQRARAAARGNPAHERDDA